MTEAPSIPEAVKNVVQRSIAVVSAFRHLRRAGAEKSSEEARAKYRKQLQAALVELDAAVVALPKIAPVTKGGATGGFDWAGFFKTATKGIELVQDLKGGKLGPKDVRQWVEAEVIDMKTPRR